jgi:hypothetical protein
MDVRLGVSCWPTECFDFSNYHTLSLLLRLFLSFKFNSANDTHRKRSIRWDDGSGGRLKDEDRRADSFAHRFAAPANALARRARRDHRANPFFAGLGAGLPNPPPPVVNASQPPADVCVPSDFLGNPIAFFDDYSWRAFIAVVWPAAQGQRGVSDAGKAVGTDSGPLVFETYEADWEVSNPTVTRLRPGARGWKHCGPVILGGA